MAPKDFLSGLIPSLAKPEKELAVLDIVKNAEKEKRTLDIAIFGDAGGWVPDAVRKRGHAIGAGKDLSIFIDQRVGKGKLAAARKNSARVAIICPSRELASFPETLVSAVDTEAALPEALEAGAEVKDLFYGLYKTAYFGFRSPKQGRSIFSVIFLFLALLFLFTFPHDPPDDLLRHVRAADYGFDYSRMYSYAWSFSFDPYIVFDYFVGAVHGAFGHFGLGLMQALCLISFFIAFWANTRDWDDRFRIFAFALVLLLVGTRITLARPASFEAAFFILALSLSGAPAVLWGSFMGILYFLSPIYLVPLAFVKREYALSLIIAIAAWYAYAGPAYFTDIIHLFTSVTSERVMQIAENVSVLNLLGNPLFLLLLFLFIKSGNTRYLVPIAFFVLLNQIRYVDVLAPLLALSLDEKKSGFGKLNLGFFGNLFFLLLAVTTLHYVFLPNQLESISLSNATVLCDSMQCMYNVIYLGENVSVSPSMEFGFSDRDIQLADKAMSYNGTLDCGLFERYRFDLLVESSLKEIPPCLELQDVEGRYRVWKVLAKANSS